MQPKTNLVVGADQANDPALPDEGATFEDLMKMAGFTDKSLAILKQNDFKSVNSLELLAEDPGAVCELQLTAQQRLLLKQHVAALTTASPGVHYLVFCKRPGRRISTQGHRDNTTCRCIY